MTPKTAALKNDLLTDWMALDWQKELGNNITSVDELKTYLPLSYDEEADVRTVTEAHPMNIPRYYLSLIDPNAPHDPIRKLAVPAAEELVVAGAMGETTKDPYGDDKHDKGNGILHKYSYTALVVATEYCSMYCRHCFRKRMVGLPNHQTVENFHNAAKYIAAHPEITNVVISVAIRCYCRPMLFAKCWPLWRRSLTSILSASGHAPRWSIRFDLPMTN